MDTSKSATPARRSVSGDTYRKCIAEIEALLQERNALREALRAADDSRRELVAANARLRSQVDTLREALGRIAGGDVMGPDNWTHADTVMAYQRIAGAALSTIKEPR